jgi:hypothetical protein
MSVKRKVTVPVGREVCIDFPLFYFSFSRCNAKTR